MTEETHQDPALRPPVGFDQSTVLFQIPQQNLDLPLPRLSSARSYADLPYLFGAQDPTMFMPKQIRHRRKAKHGSEHVKHRRTRSGCYTCRSRRVKCDEAHPVCERCKKGDRECVYPEASTSKATSSSDRRPKSVHSDTRESPGSSSEEYVEEGRLEPPGAILDGDEAPEDAYGDEAFSKSPLNRGTVNDSTDNQTADARKPSDTPSLVQDKGVSPTPSTEGSVGYAAYQTVGASRHREQSFSAGLDSLRTDWSHLPPDLQIYLTYFYENVTHLHYSLKGDSGGFLKTLFIDAALENEALLYGVVGFAAFQRTLRNAQGKIQDFLQYYNKAVSLLLKSLKRGEKHSTGTLLAILQLATIEEFLGDWVNLLGHQKAAYQILTELYTPQTIMQSEMSRVILGWYMRFDVFAGLMGGFETVLSREWFSHAQSHFQQQVVREPTNLSLKIELAVAKLRLIAMDMSIVFAKLGKGEIGFDQFMSENAAIGTRIQEWKTKMDPALQDPRYLVTDYTGARPIDPDDIVDPYIPGTIYNGSLAAMNISLIDWYSIDLMHQHQTALTIQTEPAPNLAPMAYAICQLYEAIEFYPGSPPGVVLALQLSLPIACLFLPRDERHAMWSRRKLATIEGNGYIYPHTFRTKMSELFRDQSCMHWWLPNDEAYSPIIRTIRNFVEERTAPAKDLLSEDMRDMKAVFSSMNLNDGNQNQPPNTAKRTGETNQIFVAGSNATAGGMQEVAGSQGSDAYQTGFVDERGYWPGDQGGGSQ